MNDSRKCTSESRRKNGVKEGVELLGGPSTRQIVNVKNKQKAFHRQSDDEYAQVNDMSVGFVAVDINTKKSNNVNERIVVATQKCTTPDVCEFRYVGHLAEEI